VPIDPAAALGAEANEVAFAWTASDVLRYHLALGAGARPPYERELRYTYERELRVLPTFATVAVNLRTFEPPSLVLPGITIDLAKVLYGKHELVSHRPIPVAGEAIARTRVTDVFDKGTAAVIVQETAVSDTAGSPLWTSTATLFARGEGGFGGERGPSNRAELPSRRPDAVFDTMTLPQQALLYRLCGDLNPLHVEPAFARAAGFDKPILHGLCTYGMVAKAITDGFLNGDTTGVSTISAQFAGVVYPGETVRTLVWRDGERLVLNTTVPARNEAPVLTNGVVTLR
jgi:acyl dehydratase